MILSHAQIEKIAAATIKDFNEFFYDADKERGRSAQATLGVGMKNIRVSEPPAELQTKIQQARLAISSQKKRTVKYPYCIHNSIIVKDEYQQTLEYVLRYSDELAVAVW